MMVRGLLDQVDDHWLQDSFPSFVGSHNVRWQARGADIGGVADRLFNTGAFSLAALHRHESVKARASSFIFGFTGGSSSHEETDHDAEKISHVNTQAQTDLHNIQNSRNAAPKARKALEQALKHRLEVMKPLCHEYMYHRAELLGLGGTQCQAAQGRINGMDLDDSHGPRGCLADTEVGKEPVGTPLVLSETRCTHGNRKLLCYERMEELARGDPAPGESPTILKHKRKEAEEHPAGERDHAHKKEGPPPEEGATPPPSADGATEASTKGNPEPPDETGEEKPASMDEEFRLWCHPAFRLDVLPISEDLARGVIAPKEGDDQPIAAA